MHLRLLALTPCNQEAFAYVTGVVLPHSRINTTKDWLVPLLVAPNNIDTTKRLLLPPQ
ncbi:hypothetical protein ACK4CI_05300 [Enterococcus gallinarum]|uniref:hypothetical protein n=1 Tax=Enterococcus gallinarum TaxID=1353 RepID=UPI00391A6183